MIYIWRNPPNYANKLIGEHDQEQSPYCIEYFRGQPRVADKPFVVNFEVPYSRLAKYHVLPNDAPLPLVNDRVVNLIRQYDSDAIQLLPVICCATDGPFDGYHMLNITRNLTSIDYEKSLIVKRKLPDGQEIIGGIGHLVCHPDALGVHDMARDTDFLGHILVSQRLRNAFKKAKIKGVDLREPERLFG